ncbi:MAG UNVERIFIED_CONTAM: hypothetical protein LVR18_29200 [Planctomycetaceae bacterium]|jgi:hypothetical protein
MSSELMEQGLKNWQIVAAIAGATQFLDVPDYHDGSSDVPVWSANGEAVF